jgi:hypothetical protein
MKYMYGSNKSGWLLIALVCCVVLLTLRPCESSEIKLHLDFDASDPVEYRGRIMEINHEKAQLVVAEETILVVDLMVGNYRLTTEVTDDAGNLEAFESFERGDMVLVQGFKDADGVVFAALLQKLKSRQGKRKAEITGNPIKKKGGKLGKN